MPSNISTFSDIVAKMGEERQARSEIARAKLAEIDAEFSLNEKAQTRLDLATRHYNAMLRLSGVSTPPRNDEELQQWCEELITVRKMLNA